MFAHRCEKRALGAPRRRRRRSATMAPRLNWGEAPSHRRTKNTKSARLPRGGKLFRSAPSCRLVVFLKSSSSSSSSGSSSSVFRFSYQRREFQEQKFLFAAKLSSSNPLLLHLALVLPLQFSVFPTGVGNSRNESSCLQQIKPKRRRLISLRHKTTSFWFFFFF